MSLNRDQQINNNKDLKRTHESANEVNRDNSCTPVEQTNNKPSSVNRFAVKVGEGMLAATVATAARFYFDTQQKKIITGVKPTLGPVSVSLGAPSFYSGLSILGKVGLLNRSTVLSFASSAKVNLSKSTVTTHRNSTHETVKGGIESIEQKAVKSDAELAEQKLKQSTEEKINEEQGQNPNKFTTNLQTILLASVPIATLDTLLTSHMQARGLLEKSNGEVTPKFYADLTRYQRYLANTRVNVHTNFAKNLTTATSLLFIDNQNPNNSYLTSLGICAQGILATGVVAHVSDIINYNKIGVRDSWKWSGEKISAPSVYKIIKNNFSKNGITILVKGLPYSIGATTAAFTAIHVADRVLKYVVVEKPDGTIGINEHVKKSLEFLTKKTKADHYFLSPQGFFYCNNKENDEQANNKEASLPTPSAPKIA